MIYYPYMEEKKDSIRHVKNTEYRSLKVIENCEITSGGYADIPLREPTLYSTYHFLAILNLIGSEQENNEKNLEWLREIEKNNFQVSSENHIYLRDIYYGVQSLKILGENPNELIEFKKLINQFQLSDGSYCHSLSKNEQKCQDNNSRILATYYAINILDSMGYVNSNNVSKTKNYLIMEWNDDENFKDYKSFTTIEKIVISLKLLGVNISELPKYENRKAWLTEQEKIIRHKLTNDSLNLFTLKSYYILSNEFDTLNQDLIHEIDNYLNDEKLLDGGYNALNGNYSESKGTFLALIILEDSKFSNIDLNPIIDFVKSHHVSMGGFSPAYQLTPSIDETYFALSILELFNSKPTYNENLVNFINNKVISVNQSKEEIKLKEIYYICEMFKMMNNSDINPNPINNNLELFFKSYDYEKQPNLKDIENLYYSIKLAKKSTHDINKNNIYEHISKMQNSDGGFGIKNISRTDMTFYSVSILDEIDRNPKNKTECVTWIKKGQNFDGGFRFRNGNILINSSDLYSTYLSVTTLAVLDEKPNQNKDLCNWVRKLEHSDGGFMLHVDIDDSQKMIPNLEYTYWALKILDSLEGEKI